MTQSEVSSAVNIDNRADLPDAGLVSTGLVRLLHAMASLLASKDVTDERRKEDQTTVFYFIPFNRTFEYYGPYELAGVCPYRPVR